MSFALDMEKFTKKANANVELLVRKTVFDISREVIRISPVGDAAAWKSPPPPGYVGGRFKGNWDYGVGSVPTTKYSTIDKSGQASISRIERGMGGEMAGKVHYIANNLPYAQRLEDGWSNQAPQGMVKLTVLKFQGIVDAAARSINK